MRTLLWSIGLFALAVGLAVAGRYNEGYALRLAGLGTTDAPSGRRR